MPGKQSFNTFLSVLLLFLNTNGWTARAFALGLDRSSKRLVSSAFLESASSEQGQNPGVGSGLRLRALGCPALGSATGTAEKIRHVGITITANADAALCSSHVSLQTLL